jgi:hypothetical protein
LLVYINAERDTKICVMFERVIYNNSVGDLKYKLTKKPFLHSAKFPILSAINSVINGSFNNKTATASEASTVQRNLQVETEGNIIYIMYHKMEDAGGGRELNYRLCLAHEKVDDKVGKRRWEYL